ncbi:MULTISPECIES: hypothetical protein [Clostridioides]|uniref:hypothetical protein n=1 Tax=Clostridioides sp. ZZV14-6387 TaxID=2811497 RepID=UPI0007BC5BEB|nr:hypothetical protein [Clostridioides sp. ZZV14-6387]CZR95547.1 hypothetical protein CDFC105_60335 [Clostridioides difficile]CZR99875.1 hypothetical protein CDFC105_70070 [Clostridioides difficile]
METVINKEMNINLIIEKVAREAAEKAIVTYENRKKEEAKYSSDRKLRNTKLLLKHYKDFKRHVNNSIFKVSNINENAIEILEELINSKITENLFVESISNSVSRTNIIISHINTMINIYEAYSKQCGELEVRKYRIIYKRFIDEKRWSIKEIATSENIDNRTVYRDINLACEKLSVFIFGIDGVNKF